MRTPADDEFHALGRLLGHPDPGQRHAALVRPAERVTACPPSDDGAMDVLAGLLPTTLTGPPEADLLLAGLYERLGHRPTGRPRPPWRTAGHLPAQAGWAARAVPALRHATARARPDRRSRYTEVLDRIGAGEH
ncbi:hypothetical protein ACWF9B_25565 [Streptomyces sp. NPDC055089]